MQSFTASMLLLSVQVFGFLCNTILALIHELFKHLSCKNIVNFIRSVINLCETMTTKADYYLTCVESALKF